MKSIKIKSYCKINLFLRIIRKLSNGYHNIASLITFCNLYDIITISVINKPFDKISFSGKFKNGINKNSNTITKVLELLRKNKVLKKKNFKINIKKNIPHGSGLGGGSSNAASLLNFLNTHMKLKLNKFRIEKIAKKIGQDVYICLKKQNTFLTGKKSKFLRLNSKFKLNLLIVYPNFVCSTKKIYQKNRNISKLKKYFNPGIKINRKKLINFLKEEKNDLQVPVTQIYPKITQIIDYIESQKGCYFSRISGSGSACIGIFSNMKKAVSAQKLIKLKYPKYWCSVSKTI